MMIKKINKIKAEIPSQKLYLIVINDKIVHASNPVTKILKQDPIGMSVSIFLIAKDRTKIQKEGKLRSGHVKSMVKLGQQMLDSEFEITNEEIENQTLSLVLVKSAKLVKEAAS